MLPWVTIISVDWPNRIFVIGCSQNRVFSNQSYSERLITIGIDLFPEKNTNLYPILLQKDLTLS